MNEAPLSPRKNTSDRAFGLGHKKEGTETNLGAFGLPIRKQLRDSPLSPRSAAMLSSAPGSPELKDSLSPRHATLDSDSSLSAFGLPLRTCSPTHTMLLNTGLAYFEAATQYRVQMGEAMSAHLEAIKQVVLLDLELEAAMSKHIETLKETDSTLGLYLTALLAHQENMRRYQAEIVDELYTTFIIPYRLLLDPISFAEFERMQQLQAANDPHELLAIVELLAANQESITTSALSSFASTYHSAFSNSRKSLQGVQKLVEASQSHTFGAMESPEHLASERKSV